MMDDNELEIGRLYGKKDLEQFQLRFMFYNYSTNHEVYRLGNTRLRFERIEEDRLKYLGILFTKDSDDDK